MNSIFAAIMDFVRHQAVDALDVAKGWTHEIQSVVILAGFVAWSAFFYWVGYGDGRDDKKKAAKERAGDAAEARYAAAVERSAD